MKNKMQMLGYVSYFEVMSTWSLTWTLESDTALRGTATDDPTGHWSLAGLAGVYCNCYLSLSRCLSRRSMKAITVRAV